MSNKSLLGKKSATKTGEATLIKVIALALLIKSFSLAYAHLYEIEYMLFKIIDQ
jgi:hypothetical protein